MKKQFLLIIMGHLFIGLIIFFYYAINSEFPFLFLYDLGDIILSLILLIIFILFLFTSSKIIEKVIQKNISKITKLILSLTSILIYSYIVYVLVIFLTHPIQ